ncbi:MAG: hypothetical protein ACLPGW_19260 [Roseiarcus sp.]
MSKKAAIHLALATQMAIDGKPRIGLNATLCGAPAAVPAEIAQDADAGAVRIHVRQLRAFADGLKTSAGGAGYDQNSLRNFLAQVAFLLRADDPPLKFNWSKVDPAAAGQCALFAVIDLIAAETTTFDEKRANEK